MVVWVLENETYRFVLNVLQHIAMKMSYHLIAFDYLSLPSMMLPLLCTNQLDKK
jgi:hypothetical protein